MKISTVLALCAALLGSAAQGQNLSLRQIPTREGVVQKFVYQRAASAAGAAVLLQGGTGAVGVSGSEDKGWVRMDAGFLSGGAGRFAEQGISAAVVDAPSDRANLNHGFRASAEHSQDLAAVIGFLRKEWPGQPVCLIGTSNGSLSAASAAALLGEQGPDCIVLTASVSVKPASSLVARFVHAFTDADLSKIKVPVLIVHHRRDSCRYTPYEPMPGYVGAFTHSPQVDFITIEAGQDHSDACNRGHHQFLGAEAEVSAQIAQWIKGRRKRP